MDIYELLDDPYLQRDIAREAGHVAYVTARDAGLSGQAAQEAYDIAFSQAVKVIDAFMANSDKLQHECTKKVRPIKPKVWKSGSKKDSNRDQGYQPLIINGRIIR